MDSRCMLLATLVVCVVGVAGQLPPGDLDRIDTFVEDILQCSGIPGMALAAVKDNEVVIAKGYGKANLEQGIDWDESTKFNIASVTKSFTGALLARLLNASETYTWNTPVREIIGDWFHMNNGYYSNHTTLRDLLAMKTGVPRNDILWLLDIFDRVELAERVRFLDLVYPYRTDFLYNNVMYAVAGVAAQEMGGATWEDLVTDLLFEPIGMSLSTFMDRTPDDYEGFAIPYGRTSIDDPLFPVPVEAYQGARSAGPAASVASSALDMSKWVLFWLNDAKTEDGTALLTQQELVEFLAPEFSLNSFPFNLDPSLSVVAMFWEKYAKGFFLGFYRDSEVVSHGGDMPGYHSMLHLIPSRNIGSFLSFNTAEFGIRDFVLSYINDILLEEDPWITVDEICAMLPELQEQYKSTENPDRFLLNGKTTFQDLNMDDSRPVEMLEAYAGAYGNFGYGNATVTLNQDTQSLELDFGNLGLSDLLPTLDEDIFIAQGGIFNLGRMMFSRSQGEVIDTLVMPDVELMSPPRFIRDLVLADAPPPDLDSCS